MKIDEGDTLDCGCYLYFDWKDEKRERIKENYDDMKSDLTEAINTITPKDVKTFISDSVIPFFKDIDKRIDNLEENQIIEVKEFVTQISSSVINIMKHCELGITYIES